MTATDPAAHLRPLTTDLPAGQYLAAMWARRDFAVALPLEEVRSAHQNTLLGNVWHLANPMLSVLHTLGVDTPGFGDSTGAFDLNEPAPSTVAEE